MKAHIKIHKGTYLYGNSDCYYIRDEKGKIKKIPLNKFSHNQIVTTTEKHFSKESFTRLQYPVYTDNRGWVYTENYIDRHGSGGGCGSSFNEDLYTEITDPLDILFAERLYGMLKIQELKRDLKMQEGKLSKVVFAMDIVYPEWNNVINKCKVCGELYNKSNEGNVNIRICKDCYNKTKK